MSENKSERLMEIAVKAADERLGKDIKVLKVDHLTPIADYFVIVSATNSRQMSAIIENIEEKIEQAGFDIRGIEGKEANSWTLIDAHDVIVHVFDQEKREFYNLEKLWSDAEFIDISAYVDSDES